MFNVSGTEMLIILALALIVLGPEKLPGAIRKVGRVAGELRRMANGFQAELRDAMDDSDEPPIIKAPPARAANATPEPQAWDGGEAAAVAEAARRAEAEAASPAVAEAPVADAGGVGSRSVADTDGPVFAPPLAEAPPPDAGPADEDRGVPSGLTP